MIKFNGIRGNCNQTVLRTKIMTLEANWQDIILYTKYNVAKRLPTCFLVNLYDINEILNKSKQPKLDIHVKLFDKNL